MATSHFQTSHFTSDQFVESCGAVLFDLSHQPGRACLIHYTKKDEWLLRKGRRNCGESRREAALREVQEETGYRCHIRPVSMMTRAPRPGDAEDAPDKHHMSSDIDEPFMLTVRELDGKSDVKLRWWYITAVDDDPNVGPVARTSDFTAQFFNFHEAL